MAAMSSIKASSVIKELAAASLNNRMKTRKMAPVQEVEFIVKPGGAIEAPWWTPAVGEILCAACGENESCLGCVNNNPWCG